MSTQASAADICAVAASSGWFATRCFGGPPHRLAWDAHHRCSLDLDLRYARHLTEPERWALAESMLRCGEI